jgi:two-component system, NarL family, nitrate/nitrite response regulator NarL
MRGFGLFLIDPNQLFREGLKRLLHADQFHILGEAGSLTEASALLAGEQRPDLVVLEIENVDAEAAGALLRSLRDRVPAAKFVVLTTGCSRDSLSMAVNWSVDAYLLKDMSADTLTQSLHLVMLGQQIFPTGHMAPLLNAIPTGRRPPPDLREMSGKGLSPRETQILRHLANGCSNKMIARELNISEATVKVHLNALLRKVRAANRTQAAMWALNHGMTSEGDY